MEYENCKFKSDRKVSAEMVQWFQKQQNDFSSFENFLTGV